MKMQSDGYKLEHKINITTKFLNGSRRKKYRVKSQFEICRGGERPSPPPPNEIFLEALYFTLLT